MWHTTDSISAKPDFGFQVDLDGYLCESKGLGVVDSSSDMSVDLSPLEGFPSSGSSSAGQTDGSILISTRLKLDILRVMVWSSFLAVIKVPFLATTSKVVGL